VRDVVIRRTVTVAIAVALAGASMLGVLGGAASRACAATDQRAALVVDTGTRARSYCVALGADDVSGTDLIRLAHAQYGLDYRLGFGGRAVCRLAGVGVDGGDCFGAFPEYWGYWHGDDSGGWTWANGSAADWTVKPGDVEGWQWGTGQDGTTHAMPPATNEEDVCPPLQPSPSPTPGAGGNGGSSGGNGNRNSNSNGNGNGGSQAAGSPEPTAAATQHEADDHEPRDLSRGQSTPTPTSTASSTGTPVVLAAGQGPGSTSAAGGARAAGPLLALAAVIGLGVAGAVAIRRRREAG
jgi:hypothetical protein